MKIRQFEFNMFGVNTYVAWNPDTLEAAIIDPGMIDESEASRLDSFIAERGLHPTRLLFTHLHLDHTFGYEHVAEKYGLHAEAGEADEFLGQQRDSQAAMFHIPRNPGPLKVSDYLVEGQKIMFGDDELDVLHVPGHSPGSVVLYNPSGKWVVTGDVLFRGSIGRTDLPGGDHAGLVNGIIDKVMVLPDDTVVLPGHGPATTIGEEKQSNPYL